MAEAGLFKTKLCSSEIYGNNSFWRIPYMQQMAPLLLFVCLMALGSIPPANAQLVQSAYTREGLKGFIDKYLAAFSELVFQYACPRGSCCAPSPLFSCKKEPYK
jgi:hypothetical protein